MKIVHILVISFLYVNLMGCSHSVRFQTEPSGGYLTLDDKSLGKVTEEGLPTRSKSGFGPVPYRLIYVDGFERSGVIERSNPHWFMTGVALTGPLVCAPMMCGVGLCMVNPGWGLAFLAGGVTSVGACQGLMTVASPWSLPVGMAMGSLGFLPAGLLLKAEQLPRKVMLHKIPAGQRAHQEVMPF